jgi:hypothetical protein
MATIKPRLQVLLNPETKLEIERTAEIIGLSASRLVSEFLDEGLPAIKALGDAYAQAKLAMADSPTKALEIYKDLLLEVRQSASDAQLDLEDVISASKSKNKDKAP